MSTIKLRIIVVEDQGVIALLLSEVLQNLGHEVVGIASTEEMAVEAAERFKPDLMIVDDGLGAGSGVAAVDAILQDRFVPHVFVTGDPARVHKLSRDAVILDKPFGELELGEAIKRALGAGPRRAARRTAHQSFTNSQGTS